MAMKVAMVRNMKAIMQQFTGESRGIITGVSKMRAAGTATLGDEGTRADVVWRQQRLERSLMEQLFPKGKPLGEYVPVYVALGMISLSVSLGLVTAKQQLMHAPDVRVKKSRRETLPEVVEPEHVAHKSEDYLNNSLFRKVAHIDQRLPSSLPKEPKVESLKTVGVEPVLDNGLHR